jgi:hypothetical protein
MWNGMSSRYNLVLCERVEPEVRRIDACWQASGGGCDAVTQLIWVGDE